MCNESKNSNNTRTDRLVKGIHTMMVTIPDHSFCGHGLITIVGSLTVTVVITATGILF